MGIKTGYKFYTMRKLTIVVVRSRAWVRTPLQACMCVRVLSVWLFPVCSEAFGLADHPSKDSYRVPENIKDS
jgi:hypothetical protein